MFCQCSLQRQSNVPRHMYMSTHVRSRRRSKISLEKLVQSDGELADPPARRVEDGVGDRCRGAGDTNLAEAAGSHRGLRIGDVEVVDLEVRHVEIVRHV